VQARATGAGNFGFLSAGVFNTQYNGSGILNQAIQLWAASPRNQGAGSITNTVGLHVANQNITSGTAQTTARGIEFEVFSGAGSNSRTFALYAPGGNNWLGPDNTYARKVTLGCPNTEQVCTDDFAALGSEPNGTLKYCSDCQTSTVCASGGSGAIALRINSRWSCTGLGNAAFGSSSTNSSAACETAFAATTLATGGTTTDSGLTCLPANSIIDAVVYRITTTITTAANFTIGDATIAARFCGTQSTLTAGTTGICFAQADQTGTSGPRQTSAVAVRVTTNANPGAGAIRLIVFYHTWTAPTS
jgi:hypothetical protein